MAKVICEMVLECKQKDCIHATPHNPTQDYDWPQDFCNTIASECTQEFTAICIPTDQPLTDPT